MSKHPEYDAQIERLESQEFKHDCEHSKGSIYEKRERINDFPYLFQAIIYYSGSVELVAFIFAYESTNKPFPASIVVDTPVGRGLRTALKSLKDGETKNLEGRIPGAKIDVRTHEPDDVGISEICVTGTDPVDQAYQRLRRYIECKGVGGTEI